MLQALWWLCRAGSAWKLLPTLYRTHPVRSTHPVRTAAMRMQRRAA
jgi:hypothetical protein